MRLNMRALRESPEDPKTGGAADCTSYADPDVTEHNKPPVHAVAASTGVISREYGQAVSPMRGGKLHCLPVIYSNCGRQTTGIRL